MVSSYLPALGIVGDVGFAELALLVQRAHRRERGCVVARRGLGADLVGHLRQHAADFGLRLGLGLRQQALLHHLARLHQQLAEQARRNIGAQADFLGQHAVVFGALDQGGEGVLRQPRLRIVGDVRATSRSPRCTSTSDSASLMP